MLSEMLRAKGYGNIHRLPKIKQNIELNMNNRYMYVTWTVRKISHMNACILNTQALSHYFCISNCLIILFLCMQVRDSVPLTLYSNGILMFGGPFRPYSDPVTQVSVYLTTSLYLTCVYCNI